MMIWKKHWEDFVAAVLDVSQNKMLELSQLFRSLEHEGKISWEDVTFLKELMRTMQRLDVVKKLTRFELKRDLTILLDFYPRKVKWSD